MNSAPPGQIYPFFQAAGTAVELGRQHGAQAASQIRGYLDFLGEGLQLSRSQLQTRALQFQPLFEQYCPHLLPEIEGLAEGAGVSFAEALALQLRGELGQVADGACTTFVIGPRGTADGNVLIGQTSDNPAELEAFSYVLEVRPIDRPPFVMWTFGGMLGYHGLNRHGVANFANSLGGGPGWKFAISHYPLKRMILECRTVAEVVRLMRDMPVCSNGNYVLCDGAGEILDVELTSAGPQLIEDAGEGFLVHSNHYVCAMHACSENFEQSLPDSFPRLDRLRELILSRFGRLTVADLQEFLRDHSGYPVGICRHPHDGFGNSMLPASGKTVAALIAEPAHGRLHVARGNPCTRPFVTYSL